MTKKNLLVPKRLYISYSADVKHDYWKWSDVHKAPEIVLSNESLVAGRVLKGNKNPVVLATNPLTRQSCQFRIQVVKLGNWIGVGVAEQSITVSGSRTVGTQDHCINSGYFWQNTGINVIKMHGEPNAIQANPIKVGDTVDIVVDFEHHRISYYNNMKLEGTMQVTSNRLLPGTLYPCVNLSVGTEVVLVNTVIPLSAYIKIEQQTQQQVHMWNWDVSRRAACIKVNNGGISVYRDNEPKGMNPSCLAASSLSKDRPHFRVIIRRLGKWLGIGVCDAQFVLNDNKTLGSQQKCLNTAYFYQNTGIHRLQMGGEASIDDAESFQINDIIDIKVDFDKNRIYYFHNTRLQGYLTPSAFVFKEGKVFPCVSMAIDSELSFVNTPIPELDINQKIERLALKEDLLVWNRPEKQFPTTWCWDIVQHKKAEVLDVSENFLTVKRTQGGNNPAILTTQPLTRNSNYYEVTIKAMGSWIGIGVADLNFQLNGSKTLGTQTNGINSAYFCQGNAIKLQMFGEQPITDGVREIKISQVIGLKWTFQNYLQVIGVKIDFDKNKIYYFNDDKLQGCISCLSKILEEGKIFPCINLSAGTIVELNNIDHLPTVINDVK